MNRYVRRLRVRTVDSARFVRLCVYVCVCVFGRGGVGLDFYDEK